MTVRTITAILFLVLLSSCKQPEPADAPVSTGTVTTSTAIERLVLVGMADPCDCTRKKIEKAQKAIEAASGAETIHVERLNLENDDEWQTSATLKITITYTSDPGAGTYYSKFIIPNGINDEYYFSM